MKTTLIHTAGAAALAALLACAASCDLDAWLADEGGPSVSPSKGTADISWIGLGYAGPDVDLSKYVTGAGRNASVDWSRVPLAMLSEGGSLPGEVPEGAMPNVLERVNGTLGAALRYRPADAYLRTVSLTSSDASVLSVERGDETLSYRLVPEGTGSAVLTLRAEGNVTVERSYPVTVTDRMTVKVYMDDFWLNNVTARVKYRTVALPRDAGELYMNVRDSLTVFGVSVAVDERTGPAAFRTVVDTTAFPLRQHTDRFRPGRRVILRNVSSAVRDYNVVREERSWVRVDRRARELFSLPGMLVPWRIRTAADGSMSVVLFEGMDYEREIAVDEYQRKHLERTFWRFRDWPNGVRFEEDGDGECWLTFAEPYAARQVRLTMAIVSTDPYLTYDVVTKRSQVPSATDGDEPDSSDDGGDESSQVVDSLGNTLGGRFAVRFLDGLSARERDSLARVLRDRVRSGADSVRWVLDVDPSSFGDWD